MSIMEGDSRNQNRLSSTGGSITLAIMAAIVTLFVYEFIIRDSEFGSELPQLPEWLTLLAAVGTPFALFTFSGYALVVGYGLLVRSRAGKQPMSRAVRALGAWGTAVALGGSAYGVWKMYVPVSTDGYGPEWLGFLMFPLGFATLGIMIRAMVVTFSSGNAGKPMRDEQHPKHEQSELVR